MTTPAAAPPARPVIPAAPTERLQAVVRGILGGEVFTSAQVRDPGLLTMIFLPLAFGGVSSGEPEPGCPPEPAAAPPPAPPDRGRLPEEILQELQTLQEQLDAATTALNLAQYEANWGRLEPEKLAAATRVEEAAAAALRDGQARLVPAQDLLDEEHRAAMRAHEELCLAQAEQEEAARAEWVRSRTAWEAEHEAWEAREDAWRRAFAEDLGCFYAPMARALPRGINGYPIFPECSFLNRDDWERVRVAVNRERARAIEV